MPNKYVLSVLGQDKPGIVAVVTRMLAERECNIEDLKQTILQSEFAGIFIFRAGAGLDPHQLRKQLEQELASLYLTVHLQPMSSDPPPIPSGNSFILTTIGEDRLGQIAQTAGVLKDFSCNITNIDSLRQTEQGKIVRIFALDMPEYIDLFALKKALKQITEQIGLEFSLQHRDIFKTIHRI